MKISFQPKEETVLEVYLDDEFFREIDTRIFGKKPKLPSSQLPLHEWQQSFIELEYSRAKNFVLFCLSRRSYLSKDLSQKLEERLVTDDTADKVIQELQESGYINDDEWVQNFCRQQQAKKDGPRRIMAKLYAKGVKISEDILDKEKSKSSLEDLLKTKYRKRDFSDFKEKQKVVASLIRKGFSYSDIVSLIND